MIRYGDILLEESSFQKLCPLVLRSKNIKGKFWHRKFINGMKRSKTHIPTEVGVQTFDVTIDNRFLVLVAFDQIKFLIKIFTSLRRNMGQI